MQEINQHSQGQYKIGSGTLYDNPRKMLTQGLVEDARRANRDEDSRRGYYRLTRLGRSVLVVELDRLEEVVRQARATLRPAVGRKAMTRLLYRLFLWMHPRAFKRRFGDEMLSIFDESSHEFVCYPLVDGLQPVTPNMQELMFITLARIWFIVVVSLTLWTIPLPRRSSGKPGIRRSAPVAVRLFELE